MQDVEAAVRQHDALAARFRFRDERDELRQIDEPAAAAALRVQRALQLRAADRRDADLADDDAGAEIRERRGVGRPPARRATPAPSSAMTVSPAPVTSKTSRACAGSVSGSRALLEQRHPLLAARHEQQLELELRAQRLALAQQIGLVARTRPTTASNSPRFGVSA